MKKLYLLAIGGVLSAVPLFISIYFQENRVNDNLKLFDNVLTLNQAEEAQDKRTQEAYMVTRVIDGDTIIIDLAGKNVTLRMIGVNTPETLDPRKPVECFGKEASLQTTQLLEGKKVILGFDDTQDRWDKYKRLLAYVYREDGLFINKDLIERGYAYEYTYNTPYIYQKDFDSAERDARENGRGLWASGVCEEFLTQQDLNRSESLVRLDGQDYTCKSNAYDCSHFSIQSAAQKLYLSCGGSMNDVHWLDADKDGEACESLPE